ncbi:hypothetical protein CcaverHIS002_0200530 [Cutaneotrichosporon cavernicola]|uniref:Uncharacterized protein n=1 Tax=Cutaneotrichosporon cavernicola TaxID=279322 RepID=A0AA48I7V4_9TREE|nr:uncharacterized protein CcaverHIS019_0200570 [Cutaneotrichosporon cavernicola]BEI80893.1 hypothetical protein CcaverHIS002_0200530 [Cutaneotrichosporon cavernicola]BEI88695.1 hypothetical protein CcaverHIS019_0200570 [Cutaneotrichosporon cavernicola]BEI96469.1 hypothetical protein CcaverHIS631_0200580 [Cutaneotrichosporon cavernicola]BEJ04241.1 hypothetical protein CcaverHIS641_0200580 [Cutaneotrichosporon cavernicola]
MDTQPSTAAAGPAPRSWRDDGRHVPHDTLVQIAHYLGDMMDDGDDEARLTLASMMRVSSEGLDAAARPLYSSVTVTRDNFSQLFGGNDMNKSKLFEHLLTFPTRQSVIRKLGLFQWVRHLHVEELPCEQAVSDLMDAFRVACSQPSSGVACQQALGGRLFPRLQGVSFGPNVFLNQHSAPPLGPEIQGAMHRFLTFLRREADPIHMCLQLPSPLDIAKYRNNHHGAERPCRPSDPATPGGTDPAIQPTTDSNSLTLADQATWPASLARAWGIKTISVHDVRFTLSVHNILLRLPCERLRLFAPDGPCSLRMCEDGPCIHHDQHWGRAAAILRLMFVDDKDGASFKVVEIANVGAGYPLKCDCVEQYAHAMGVLKSYMRSRTEGASWKLDLPHCAEAADCECCGAPVAQTGDTGDGSPLGGARPNNCSEGHRWQKAFQQELLPVTGDNAAGANAAGDNAAAGQGAGAAPPASILTTIATVLQGMGSLSDPLPTQEQFEAMQAAHALAAQSSNAQLMDPQMQAMMAAHMGSASSASLLALLAGASNAVPGPSTGGPGFASLGSLLFDEDSDDDDVLHV